MITDASLAEWDALLHAVVYPASIPDAVAAWDRLQGKVWDDFGALLADVRLLRMDIRKERAVAMQRNTCLAELVAIVHELAPNHEVLTRLPYSQILTNKNAPR